MLVMINPRTGYTHILSENTLVMKTTRRATFPQINIHTDDIVTAILRLSASHMRTHQSVLKQNTLPVTEAREDAVSTA